MRLIYRYDDLGVREFRTTARNGTPSSPYDSNELTVSYSLMFVITKIGGNYMRDKLVKACIIGAAVSFGCALGVYALAKKGGRI